MKKAVKERNKTSMTEKEKMQKQKPYAGKVGFFLDARAKAKDLCYQFNQRWLKEDEKFMKQLLGKTKNKFCFTAPFWCDYGCNIEIGENFHAETNLVIHDWAKVTFGDNVWIGQNCGFYTIGRPIDLSLRNQGLEYAYPMTGGDYVFITSDRGVYTAEHPIDLSHYASVLEYARPITVGDNVSIGPGVQVMPGVTIGNNVYISSGTVVVEDIPDNSKVYDYVVLEKKDTYL